MKQDKRLKSIDQDYLQAKPLKEYPGYYISLSQRIYSIKELKPRIHSDGYKRVCLYGSVRGKLRQGIHQLMAKAFLACPKGHTEVRHLDGNRHNNSLENLAWGTRKMNAQDAARHGRMKGGQNANSKLVEADIIVIRKRYLAGTSCRKIAKEYGVCLNSISNIVNRKSWRHI